MDTYEWDTLNKKIDQQTELLAYIVRWVQEVEKRQGGKSETQEKK